jgi:hypothetical protein
VNDTGFTLNPRIYDFLKWIALVVLPAVAALVIGLGISIHWDDATAVAGIVTLVDTFLGAILGKSASNFKKQEPDNVLGDLIIMQSGSGVPTGMRIVGTKENPIFTEGTQVLLNVKREQAVQ